VFYRLKDTTPEPPHYFVRFSDDLRLAEIILGERSEANLDAVRALVAPTAPLAVAYRARLARRTFRVVLDGNTRPPGSPQN
jgi:hypothetical protein